MLPPPDARPDADALWRLTVENSPIGMALTSAEGVLLSANRALCAMLGRPAEELRAVRFTEITHPDDVDAGVGLYQRTLAGEIDDYRLVKRYLRADGSVVWGDLSVALVRDDDGAPLHFICQVVDVTAQRADRHRLAEAVEHLERERHVARAILDTVDVGLLLMDSDGRYERMNRRHADFLALAYPDGHHGRAGQLGAVYAADGCTRLTRDEMPTSRALSGEEFDDLRIWVGEDPLVRRALSVSSRAVGSDVGCVQGAALAYSDVTDLMRAMRVRDDFVATVSHELRTPLTSVLNHLELLRETGAGAGVALQPDEVDRSLEVVHRNAQRLHAMVADLLTSASQRNGDLVLERVVADVVPVVQEAVYAAQPAARKRGVDLALATPALLSARVDPPRLRQVVDNLVSNAVGYTPAGGRVDVVLHQRQDRGSEQVVLEVRDTGTGIEARDLDQIFSPFYRAPEARRRATPGLGLGLAIVRAIVEAHGGRVEVDSTPGEGTTVRVDLPAGASAV